MLGSGFAPRVPQRTLRRWAWALLMMLLAARGIGQLHAYVHADGQAHGHGHVHVGGVAHHVDSAHAAETWLGHALGDEICLALDHGLSGDGVSSFVASCDLSERLDTAFADRGETWQGLNRVAPRARDPPKA